MFLLQSSEMSVTFWGARVKISKWLVLVAISTAQWAWETQKVSCGPKDSHQRAWDWIVIQSLEPVEIALILPVFLSTYLIGRCVAMFCLWGFQVSLPKKVMPTPKNPVILVFWICFCIGRWSQISKFHWCVKPCKLVSQMYYARCKRLVTLCFWWISNRCRSRKP